MAHDIFISYSSRNAAIADAVCARLEAAHMRCWYAPRDIETGENWAGSINRAIKASKILVLIYTDDSNASVQVLREINLAASAGIVIVPLRLTGTDPAENLRYYLSGVHWMDAMNEELDQSIGQLVKYCEVLMETENAAAAEKAEQRRKEQERKRKRIIALCCTLTVLLAGAVWLILRQAEENRITEGYLVPQENRPVVFAALSKAEAGDFVAFGSYEQDNNPDNGPEPITWKVLAREPDSLLLLSWYGLEYQPYSTEESGAWDVSGIRAWLNGTFLNTAFSEKEKKRLITAEYEPDRNPVFGTDPGQATQDTVRLLTVAEKERYLDEDAGRAYATETLDDFTVGQYGRNEKEWWQLTPGGSIRRAITTDYARMSYFGARQNKEEVAARPLIRIRAPHREEKAAAEPEAAEEAEPGYRTITLGRYEQDGDPLTGPEPIEWIVLEEKADELLLISRYVLDAQGYHTTSQTPEERQAAADDISLLDILLGIQKEEPNYAAWSESTLRRWLNSVFLYAAFTGNEREAIVETDVEADVNPIYKTTAGTATRDRLFLPGISDIQAHPDEEFWRTEWTAYAQRRNGRLKSLWWLRTPGGNPNSLVCVDAEGKRDDLGQYIKGDASLSYLGVRPMLRIRPSMLTDQEIPEGNTQILATDLNHIVYGRYEQDDNPDNGPEPILWDILDIQGNRALLLANWMLDTHVYKVLSGGYKTTWEISPVRKLLNGPFLQGAFSEAERAKILLTTNFGAREEESKLKDPYDSGNDTEDYIFLPNADEIKRFFPEEEQRLSEPTDYAWHQHYNASIHPDYLLRDGYVTNTGNVYTGYAPNNYQDFIRPMMWVEDDYFEAIGPLFHAELPAGTDSRNEKASGTDGRR